MFCLKANNEPIKKLFHCKKKKKNHILREIATKLTDIIILHQQTIN